MEGSQEGGVQKMTTAEIMLLLGHKDEASTRAWLRRMLPRVPSLKPVGRQTDTGRKVYRADAVQQAIDLMPFGPKSKRQPPTS